VQTGHATLVRLAQQPGMTVGKLYRIMAGASGHNITVGTPADIADVMEDWFRSGACDGFNIMATHLTDAPIPALETLVPELQRRGLAQTEYTGTTLRQTLGLARPAFGSYRRRQPVP
jgi:alkanesulfonate monooxygenase